MNELSLASSWRVGYVRVYKGRFGVQIKLQVVHIFSTKLKFTERELRSLGTSIVELANEGRGEHRASREAGDGAHCGREGRKPYPGRTGGELVARGAGGVQG